MSFRDKLILDSYRELYKSELEKDCDLEYSGRLKAFNANARMSHDKIIIKLSSKWRIVSEDIQKGLIQHLLVRILKKPAKSMNIDLYHSFIKNLSTVISAQKVEPVLKESFERVNEKYFYSLIEIPNLVFGKGSVRTLGSYNFQTNTVTISPILNGHNELIDYVVYHELLHKKMQFKANHMKASYHSKDFRIKEKEFENSKHLEVELGRLLGRRKRFFLFD